MSSASLRRWWRSERKFHCSRKVEVELFEGQKAFLDDSTRTGDKLWPNRGDVAVGKREATGVVIGPRRSAGIQHQDRGRGCTAGERDFSPPLGKTNPHQSLSTARRRWRRRGREARRGRLARVVSVVAGGGSLKNTPQPHRAAPPQKPPSSTAEPKRDRAS